MFHRAAALACVTTALVYAATVGVMAEGETAFTFTVANAPKTGLPEDRLQVTVDRWSTDSERDRIASLLAANDTATIAYTLRNADAAGHLRWPGGLEYTLRYARRTPRADGGADIVLVADSRVWVWWDGSNDIGVDEPFTVFHVRVDKNGVGQGRVAPASKVRSDKTAGVAVVDVETRPALITDVRPQRS
jgi:hypothetical protein